MRYTPLAILRTKWLDYKIQQLKPCILIYIKDRSNFLRHIKVFQKLQRNIKLKKSTIHFTVDEKSMYTCIDTDTTNLALEALQLFLEEVEREGNSHQIFT